VAHWLTNRGKLLLMQGDWDDAAGGDYLVGLLVGASIPTAADTEAEVQDLNFVSELLALSGVSECTASEDDTNNRVNMDASDLTFTALVTGQSIWGGFIFKTGASDAARALMSVFTLAAVVPTNGSNFTLTIADVVRAS
jgi:hypothetical protein